LSLDLSPSPKSDDILVRLEADTLTSEIHLSRSELLEHALHDSHRMHQQRDAINHDPIPHLGQGRWWQNGRSPALEHIGKQRHIKGPADPRQLGLIDRRLDEQPVRAGLEGSETVGLVKKGVGGILGSIAVGATLNLTT
jgi:hypothetical protein